MKKTYRLKREKDFQAMFKAGHSVANRRFVIYSSDNDQGHFRLGLSVSKKLGNAVVRNRVKRQLRHLIHEIRLTLPAKDILIISRKGVEELSYQEMRSNLHHVLKLANLYQEGSTSDEKD